MRLLSDRFTPFHQPVLFDVVEDILFSVLRHRHLRRNSSPRALLSPLSPSRLHVVDATFGTGGHTLALVRAAERFFETLSTPRPHIRIDVVDRDDVSPVVREAAEELCTGKGRFGDIKLDMQARAHIGCLFSEMQRFVVRSGGDPSSENALLSDGVDVVCFDFGTSSMQLDTDTREEACARGFSFRVDGANRDAPLDMRMGPHGGQLERKMGDGSMSSSILSGVSAREWLRSASVRELSRVFVEYGEESVSISRRIAECIVAHRREGGSLDTVGEFVGMLAKRNVVPGLSTSAESGMVIRTPTRRKTHPLTRIFQAIRIYINDELNEIEVGLSRAHLLTKNSSIGLVIAISFHSLEDRIVKKTFSRWVEEGTHEWWIRKQTPSPEEIAANPRSRSAILRSVIRKEHVS